MVSEVIEIGVPVVAAVAIVIGTILAARWIDEGLRKHYYGAENKDPMEREKERERVGEQ